MYRLEIVTNNLAGAVSFQRHGRSGTAATADLILPCHLLPGRLNTTYSATLDASTITHLDHMKSNSDTDTPRPIWIALVTGNYISLKDGVLYRGDEHGAMKAAWIHHADYVFLVSPLGKLFDKPASAINEMLKTSRVPSARHKVYKILQHREPRGSIGAAGPNSAHADCLVPGVFTQNRRDRFYLVTTTRHAGAQSIYPHELDTYFQVVRSKITELFEKGHVIQDIFRPEVDSDQVIADLHLFQDKRHAFLNYEFPHQEVREHMERELFG